MSTGIIGLDILLQHIIEDSLSGEQESIAYIKKRYPSLSDKEAIEILKLVSAAAQKKENQAELVATTPPSFSIRTKTTKNVVAEMLESAKKSILITGYSLSGYFEDMTDCIIRKSQAGVYVKFYVNNIESQPSFEKLRRHKGNFLKIYNYPEQSDSMSALHAKVISVDKMDNLITSANLSYHGQEGNIELGTHIYSEEIGKQIDDIFTQLLHKRVFVEV